MANKPTLRGVARHSVRGWGAVLAGGILLTVLALVDAPGDDGAAGVSTSADGSTSCQMQVTAAELRVRSGPSINTAPLETLRQGQVVDATTEVTDGFRRLEGDRWAANEYLVPVAGRTC
jgi:hypothetical protein